MGPEGRRFPAAGHDRALSPIERHTCAIGSRERLQRQWDLIPDRDEERLRRIVREVPLDPGFPVLLRVLRAAGAEIVVLSDGYGFYAEEAGYPGLGSPPSPAGSEGATMSECRRSVRRCAAFWVVLLTSTLLT